MPPSSSSPNRTASGAPPRFHVSYRSGVLEGWLAWPDDTLFRPSIGIFQEERLIEVVRTRRVWCEERGLEPQYLCRFRKEKFDPAKLTGAGEVSITCLERGEVMHHFPAQSEAVSKTISIDAIRRMAQSANTATGTSGFVSFLKLPLLDQLQILYLDLLRRPVEPSAVKMRHVSIAKGDVTILDIRDEILDSEEFRGREQQSREQQIGFWCVWEGLNDVPMAGMARPDRPGESAVASAFASYLVTASSSVSLGRHLGRIAVPGDPAAAEAWRSRNAALISTLEDASAISRRRLSAAASSGPVRGIQRALLSSMRAGVAGERVGSHIRSVAGKSGHVAFGPYITMPPGTYRVRVGLSAEPAAAGATGRLSFEVSSGAILFGRTSIAVSRPISGTYDLDFAIPPEEAELLHDAKYEVRVTSDGTVALELELVSIETLQGADTIPYPAVENWLPLLSRSKFAVLTDAGQVDRVDSARGGHMVFGPYVSLLPGRYTLVMEITLNGADGRGENIEVDVAVPGAPPIMAQPFPLQSGTTRHAREFSIQGAATRDKLPGPLEFRIAHHGKARFRLEHMRVELQSPFAITAELPPEIAARYDNARQARQVEAGSITSLWKKIKSPTKS